MIISGLLPVLYFISQRMKIFLNGARGGTLKVLITRRVMGFRASFPLGSRSCASLGKQTRTTTVWSEYEYEARRVAPSWLRAN